MQNIRGINLSTYTPIHPLSYYGKLSVTEAGSLCTGSAISDDVSAFLSNLGLDVGVWDGSRGVLGRSFVPQVANPSQLDRARVKQLRNTYIDVKRSLYVNTTRQELRQELKAQLKLQAQLDSSVLELEVKSEKVRKRVYQCKNHKEDKSDALGSLTKLLNKLEKDLVPRKKAAEAIHKKVLQTRAGIVESENGFIRRFAILRTVFGKDSVVPEAVLKIYKGNDDLNDLLQQTDKEATKIWQRVQHAKKFFVDAKLGVVHLYEVETALKSILEHLEAALNSQNGITKSTLTPLPSDVSVNYRLGYIRRLWDSVNPAFQASIPYIKLMSLKNGIGPVDTEGGGVVEPMNEIWQHHKTYGIFAAGEILPSYSKIERTNNLSRTSRIAKLHACASDAYKVINSTYDCQEQWIRDAYTELADCEREERMVTDKLIGIWETLLAISTDNM